MTEPDGTIPVVCDMAGAPDTGAERLAEFDRLFRHALAGRERTPEGIRFRLHARDGVEDWVRDLAAREQSCCPFFGFRITREGEELHWDVTVVDDDAARAILEEFYQFPDPAARGTAVLEQRLRQRGVQVTDDAAGTVSRFTTG